MKITNDWIKFFCSLFFIGLILFFFAAPFAIEGNSMCNTIKNQDRVLVSRILSKFSLKRGDIVICNLNLKDNLKDQDENKNKNKNSQKKDIIKRIIALPGEHIIIKNNLVYINKKILKEPYIKNIKIKDKTNDDINLKFINLKLNKDEYFIMGDNRNISLDSRSFGVIKKSNIKAKVLFKFWSDIKFINYHNYNLGE